MWKVETVFILLVGKKDDIQAGPRERTWTMFILLLLIYLDILLAIKGYLKIFLLVAACTYAALLVCCSQCPLKGGGGSVPEVVKEAVVTNPSTAPWSDSGANVAEPIHTGTPNF